LPTRIQSSPRFGGQDSQVLLSIKITQRSFFGTSVLRFHLCLLNPLLLHHLVHIRPWNVNTRDIGMVCLWLFVTPWTIAHQAFLSMGFSRQEFWSGFPFPSPGDPPDPGIKPRSPALQAYSLLCKPPWKPPKTFSSVQSLSCVWLFATPWITARQAFLSITNSRTSFKLVSIEKVMPSSHLILCHPLLLLPPIPPRIRVFSNESALRMRWPKYWSFSCRISPSNEHPGLISFRMDWLDLLAVQGTLKSLLQHYSSKASILRRSVFFTVQLSHPYTTTGKTIALTRRTFVGKVMSLLWICYLGWS